MRRILLALSLVLLWCQPSVLADVWKPVTASAQDGVSGLFILDTQPQPYHWEETHFIATIDPLGTNPSRVPQAFVFMPFPAPQLVQLTTLDAGVGTTGGRFDTFSVSDDGLWLLFDSHSDPFGLNPLHHRQVFLLDRAGSILTQLTDNPAYGNLRFEWQPPHYIRVPSILQGPPEFLAARVSGSGQVIAFTSRQDLTGDNPTGQLETFVMNRDGSGLVQVSGVETGPLLDVSDDGSRLLVRGADEISVWAVASDGTDPHQIDIDVRPLPRLSGNGAIVTATGYRRGAHGGNWNIWAWDWAGNRTFSEFLGTAFHAQKHEVSITDNGRWGMAAGTDGLVAYGAAGDPYYEFLAGSFTLDNVGPGVSPNTAIVASVIHAIDAVSLPNPVIGVLDFAAGEMFETIAELESPSFSPRPHALAWNATRMLAVGAGDLSIVRDLDGSNPVPLGIELAETLFDQTRLSGDASELFRATGAGVMAYRTDGTAIARTVPGCEGWVGELFLAGETDQLLLRGVCGELPQAAVYLLDSLDGSRDQVCTSCVARNLSADGEWALVEQDEVLYRYRTDGSSVDTIGDVQGATISRDGQRVVFSTPETFWSLWDAASQSVTSITQDHSFYDAVISPDGASVYFAARAGSGWRNGIYRYDIAAADFTFLSMPLPLHDVILGEFDVQGRLLFASAPTWVQRYDLGPTGSDRAMGGGYSSWLLDPVAQADLVVSGPAPTTVTWDDVVGATGYDLVRGHLDDVHIDGEEIALGEVRCLVANSPIASSAASADGEDPDPGKAFFYVMRPAGTQAFGVSSDGMVRRAGVGDCPDVD